MARKSFMNDRRHVLQLNRGERVLMKLSAISATFLAMAIRSDSPNPVDWGIGYRTSGVYISLKYAQEASKGKDAFIQTGAVG